MPAPTTMKKPRAGAPRGPRRVARPVVAAVAASLALSGCGDMNPQDLETLIDQVEDFTDELSELTDEAQDQTTDDPASDEPSEFDKRMGEAKNDWDSYPEPPEAPALEEPYEYVTTHADGSESATSEQSYGAEYESSIDDHYTEVYGQEPTRDGDTTTWSNEKSTTTASKNTDGTISVTSVWKP